LFKKTAEAADTQRYVKLHAAYDCAGGPYIIVLFIIIIDFLRPG